MALGYLETAPGASILWRRLPEAALQNSSQKQLQKAAPGSQAPELPRRLLACRLVSYVRICLNWVQRVAPGAASVWVSLGLPY